MGEQKEASYKWATVQDVKCIVWSLNPNEENVNNDKKKRKQEKNFVICNNLDIPMLDQRRDGSHIVYCDIIMNTNNIKGWESSMIEYYKGFKQDINPIGSLCRIIFNQIAPYLEFSSLDLI